MSDMSAGIEYDPVTPRPTRRLPLRLIALTAALLLAGFGGWMLHGWFDGRQPGSVVIGNASDFPPGSVTEVVLDEGHFDPVGLESPAAENPGPRGFGSTRLFVVSEPESGLSAVSLMSPWMGCRVGVVTRTMAIDFGHEVPTDFEKGFLDPCHGSLFSLHGQHLGGPGTRGLVSFPVKYLPNGTVIVDLTAAHIAG